MRFYFIICCFFITSLHGQSTFSKIYDVDSQAIRNYFHDFEILNENIYTYSTIFCDPENELDATCLALRKYNMSGEVIKTIIIDTLNSYDDCIEGFTSINKSLFISTYVKGEKYKSTSIIQYDYDLRQQAIHKYNGPNESSQILNEGINCVHQTCFIYGNIRNTENPDSVQVIKTDIDGNELWTKYYSFGSAYLYINNVLVTPDNNLAFILELESLAGANNGFDGYQLMKIDTSGALLDSFVFEELPQQPNRLLTTSDSGYVFSSEHHPFDGVNIFTTGYGLINKMDKEMDTLDWSLVLPNDQLVDGRHYRMYDYIEASNGDIIACGMSYDNTDTELDTGVSDKNSTWNGFIVRITADGEIKWLRLYKNPNDLLPHDEYGKFRPSRLNKIKELPDGRFIAAGDVFVNNSQLSAIDEFETEVFHLWLLTVDENGCIEGYDCNEIIRINSDFTKSYKIGNQWIYEEEDHIGGGNSNIGFKTFEVQDTLFDGTHTKYILSNEDTFYVENDKMYFWDEYYQEYIMYYDWEETSSYDIKYYDQFTDSEKVATVMIDSVSYKYFGNDSLKTQHIRILNSGTTDEYKDVVYEGIGAGYYGIKFLLGCGLCDDIPKTTRLRCFINDTMTYHFVPYSCDSTWIKTGTKTPLVNKITVYPNPTTQKVHIRGINMNRDYELYSIEGQFISSGKTTGRSVNIPSPGVYILRLKIGIKWVEKKILRID